MTEHKTDMNSTKTWQIQKNWTTKYERTNTQPMQTKIINYTRRFRYNEPLKNINKIEKYKKLNIVKYKTDINSIKLKNTKTEHGRTQNRH